MKQPKVIGKFNNKVKMQCPNCGESIVVFRGLNKWCSWFRGECYTCGYVFKLKDNEFDYIQPDSPFFELVYKYNPDSISEKNKKDYEKKKDKRKAELERKYWEERYDPTQKHSRLRADERRTIEKEVLMGD